jgi:hypothetical protein
VSTTFTSTFSLAASLVGPLAEASRTYSPLPAYSRAVPRTRGDMFSTGIIEALSPPAYLR